MGRLVAVERIAVDGEPRESEASGIKRARRPLAPARGEKLAVEALKDVEDSEVDEG